MKPLERIAWGLSLVLLLALSPATAQVRPGPQAGGGGSALTYVSDSVTSGTQEQLQITIDDGMWVIHAVAVGSDAMNVSFSFNDDTVSPAAYWLVNGSTGYSTSRQVWSTSDITGANISRQFFGRIKTYRTAAPGTIFEVIGEFADKDIKGFADSYSNGTEALESIELNATGSGDFAAGSILEAWKLPS